MTENKNHAFFSYISLSSNGSFDLLAYGGKMGGMAFKLSVSNLSFWWDYFPFFWFSCPMS